MSTPELIVIYVIIAIPMLFGVWFGLRLTGREFASRPAGIPGKRTIVVGLVITALVLVGAWIGNRGQFNDPVDLYGTAALWVIAMAAAFFTKKKV